MQALLLSFAESSSLDRLIESIELLLSFTAAPAAVGLAVLFLHRFRRPGAVSALVLGLLTMLLALGTCGFLLCQDAAWEWYRVPCAALLLALVVCALALRARRLPPAPAPC